MLFGDLESSVFSLACIWGHSQAAFWLCPVGKRFNNNSQQKAPQICNVFHLGLVPMVPNCASMKLITYSWDSKKASVRMCYLSKSLKGV